MIRSMLTTIDNPFDPFDEFDAWYTYDETHGYHTCQVLANFLNNDLMIEVSDLIRIKETELAIDKIIKLDPLNIYKKVQKDVEQVYVSKSNINIGSGM